MLCVPHIYLNQYLMVPTGISKRFHNSMLDFWRERHSLEVGHTIMCITYGT